MSGKIGYILNIEGLDANIAKLKTLNDLLNQINRKGGSSNIGQSVGNNKQNVNSHPVEAGLIAGIAASTSGGRPSVAKFKNDLNKLRNIRESQSNKSKSLLDTVSSLVKGPIISKSQEGTLHDIFKSSKEYINDLTESEHFNEEGKLKKLQYTSGSSLKGVAQLAKGYGPEDLNLPQFSGIPLPDFSKIFKDLKAKLPKGLQELFSSKGLKELFHLSGVTGTAGRLAGIFSKLGAVGIVAAVSIGAFVIQLKLIIAGIKEASQAYITAARRGINVASSKRLDSVFGALGIGSPDLSKIAPQLGRGNDVNAILTAAQTGQLGEDGQQLVNMAEDFKRLMRESEDAARQTQEASRAGFQVSVDIKEISIEWKALLSQISALSYNTLHIFLQAVKSFLHYINDLLEGLIQFEQIIGLIPKDDDSKNRKSVFSGGSNQSSTTSLEKMGFIFGSAPGYGSVGKNTATIASNSTIMVKLLTKLANHSPDVSSFFQFLP